MKETTIGAQIGTYHRQCLFLSLRPLRGRVCTSDAVKDLTFFPQRASVGRGARGASNVELLLGQSLFNVFPPIDRQLKRGCQLHREMWRARVNLLEGVRPPK